MTTRRKTTQLNVSISEAAHAAWLRILGYERRRGLPRIVSAREVAEAMILDAERRLSGTDADREPPEGARSEDADR